VATEMTLIPPAIPTGVVPEAAASGSVRPAAPPLDESAGDAELALAARRGDRRAADLLARRYRRPAYLLALQILRDPEDALDVAHDALLRFFTHLDRLEAGRQVRPWLFAIVRNRARDLLRRRRVRRHEPLASDDPDRPGIVLVDETPGPEAVAARRELQARIWRALGALDDKHREILVLREYHDLSYEEIAGVLRLPVGTVMSRLHRARRALRAALGGAAGGETGA